MSPDIPRRAFVTRACPGIGESAIAPFRMSSEVASARGYPVHRVAKELSRIPNAGAP
jgi:hypothetical protein